MSSPVARDQLQGESGTPRTMACGLGCGRRQVPGMLRHGSPAWRSVYAVEVHGSSANTSVGYELSEELNGR